MTIYKALLRYSYAAFRLEILEFCTPEKLMEREQFYIDKYKPEYNILKVAGSSFGFRLSKASKELMSLLAKGRFFCTETLLKMKERTVSEEVKLKISAALKGRKITEETKKLISTAALGRKRTKKTLLKMAFNNNKRQPIILTNLESDSSKEFIFMKDAAEYLKTSHTQIRNYLKNNKPYKGYSIYLKEVK
jgi:group I intron endonuclease